MWLVTSLVLAVPSSIAQINIFPYTERFDSLTPPALPVGWTSTTNRLPSGDFVSSSSSPHTTPNCAYSSNSTISQSLVSPAFDFAGRTPDKLQFYVARSSTHTSGLLVEASIDAGVTFPIALSDTIKNPGTTSYVFFSIPMPGPLANQNGVKYRWRIVGGTGGATATFRLDDIIVTTLVSCDLAVGGATVSPTLPTSQDSLLVRATLKNLGIQTATNYVVNFFCDFNNNSIPDGSERFATVAGPPILASDSATILAGHSPLKPGDYKFFAIVSLPQDERTSNDTAAILVSVGYPRGSMLVNEIMYAPVGDEPEWVELCNVTADSVNLKNWKISDLTESSKNTLTVKDVFIPPLGYCIIAKDAAFVSLHLSLTSTVIIASFGALNNTTPDAVIIYDSRSQPNDSVYYLPAWGGQGGRSLERIDLDQASTDSRNWGTSQDSAFSTPGKQNSIVRMSNDLRLKRLYQSRTVSNTGVVPVINCVVENCGKKPVPAFALNLFLDADNDGTVDTLEQIARLSSTSPIGPMDSVVLSFTWESLPAGESQVTVNIEFAQDERLVNNRATIAVCLSYPPRSLVINEIMEDPLAGQNEWVEFYNRGTEVVDVRNWTLCDRPTASGSINTTILTPQSCIIPPSGMLVVAADSTIVKLFPYLAEPMTDTRVLILNKPGGFGLANEGDDVVLLDITGFTIDSVSYSALWHRPDVTDTKGRSLEKINPDLDGNTKSNWTTCVLGVGGSPGRSNSIATSLQPTTSAIAFSPNPFSPDGDGFEDFCIIQYKMSFSSGFVHIRIFDRKGRLVRVLANAQLSGGSGEILWDGRDEDKQRVRVGPYIVLIQATDTQGGEPATAKGVVVVATRL